MREFDGLPQAGRGLVCDFGMFRALSAYSQTGDWDDARTILTAALGEPLRRRRAPSVGSGGGFAGAPR